MPFSSPMTHPASTSSTTEHIARFQNPQMQQQLLRVGSPRQGGPGPTQPPRPPSTVQSAAYPSTSPHLNQGNSPNNPPFNPPPALNMAAALNGITPDKFMSAIRDSLLRKGAAWNGQPGFRGKELDLYKVWTTCLQAGGFDRVGRLHFRTSLYYVLSTWHSYHGSFCDFRSLLLAYGVTLQ